MSSADLPADPAGRALPLVQPPVVKEARRPKVPLARAGQFLRMAALFVVFSAVYEVTRHFVGTDSIVAPLEHARSVTSSEKAIGLLIEPRQQSLVVAHPPADKLTVWVY